jgi:hypothetical protein
MAYIGHQPAEKYVSLAVQHFTVTATASYVLTQSVTSQNEIALFINNVRQEPGGSYAYTAAGTTLTLSAATAGTDTMYCVYLGKAIGTVSPPDGSVNSAKIVDGSITDGDLAGSISSAKITSLDATKLTGTVAEARLATLDATKLTGTVADARITALTASKLSGVVPTANLGTGTASSTTVLYGDGTYKAEPVTDTTSIKNDISLLALQTAINGNLSAYGLKNSWIEQFEDSTKIENLSTALRDTNGEYMMAGAVSSQTLIPRTDGTAITNTNTAVGEGNMAYNAGLSAAFDGTDVKTAALSAATIASGTPRLQGWIGKDWGAGVTKVVTGFKAISTSNDGMHGGGATSGNSIFLYGNSANAVGTATLLGTISNVNFRQMSTTYEMLSGLVETAYRYHWVKLLSVGTTHQTFATQIKFYDEPNTVSAAGSFNSTDVTPSDGAAKTSVGLVLLYKDAGSSSCVLNTDVVVKVRANTGQAYQTLVLAGIDGTTTPPVTYSNSLKVAIAPAITVTSGTALSYEITWANQSAGTKEAQIYGVAMTY